MKIDLHCHSSEYSACSRMSAEELVRAARLHGLDAVAITDHYRYLSDEDRDRLQQIEPELRIFRGIEISLENPAATEGWEDIVIISEEDPTPLHPIRTNALEAFHDFVRETGALVIHAHPYRFHDSIIYDPADFRPDAVEIASCNLSVANHDKIAKFCRKNDFNAIATSDAHGSQVIGLHCIELDRPAANERELGEIVREGAFTMRSHEPTFSTFYETVNREEELARRVLSAGGDVHNFLHAGGSWAGIFKNARKGLSSLPNEKALELRNPV
ncbi:MAG: PHP domain-containing protein [Candidatus Sumerlaeota bacterium]